MRPQSTSRGPTQTYDNKLPPVCASKGKSGAAQPSLIISHRKQPWQSKNNMANRNDFHFITKNRNQRELHKALRGCSHSDIRSFKCSKQKKKDFSGWWLQTPFIRTTSVSIHKSDLNRLNAGVFLFYEKVLGWLPLNQFKVLFTLRTITIKIMITILVSTPKNNKVVFIISVCCSLNICLFKCYNTFPTIDGIFQLSLW